MGKMVTFESCPECDSLDVAAYSSPHDPTELEYRCRECGADWVEWDT